MQNQSWPSPLEAQRKLLRCLRLGSASCVLAPWQHWREAVKYKTHLWISQAPPEKWEARHYSHRRK